MQATRDISVNGWITPTRALALAALTLFAPAAGLGDSFRGIGVFPSPSYSDTLPNGMSGDGTWVVGRAQVGFGGDAVRSFRWSEGTGLEDLGVAIGHAVSNDGAVVVGRGPSGATRWTQATGIVDLGSLGTSGLSQAEDVSADGSVVVGISAGIEAFKWTEATGMVALEKLPGNASAWAHAVSADGSIIVGESDNDAVLWSGTNAPVPYGFLPGAFHSIAMGVSADGTIAVGGSGNQAFRWTPQDGMQGLGFVSNSPFSFAHDVSADGVRVVGEYSVDTAMIWDPVHGMRDLKSVLEVSGLDLTGWTLGPATAISDDGRTITGWGINPDGVDEGWVAVLERCTLDAKCDDGLFCNGAETCHPLGICEAGAPPCSVLETCEEPDLTCTPKPPLAGCRDALAAKDIVTADGACQQAVADDPTDQEARFLRAGTRVLRLAEEQQDGGDGSTFTDSLKEMMDRFGLGAAGRSLYAFTAPFPKNATRQVDLPDNAPTGGDVQQAQDDLAVIAALDASLADLAVIDPSFETRLDQELEGLLGIRHRPKASRPLGYEVDFADVKLFEAVLHGLKAGLLTGSSLDAEFDLDAYTPVGVVQVQPQLIDANPSLGTLRADAGARLAAAKASHRASAAAYLEASQLMRDETDDQHDDLLGLAPKARKDEIEVRFHLRSFERSLDGPTPVLCNDTRFSQGAIRHLNRKLGTAFDASGGSLDLKPLFDLEGAFAANDSLRSLAPEIDFDAVKSSNFVRDANMPDPAFADTTFNGAVQPVTPGAGCDIDFDGVPEDGDGSGVAGDAPCASGATDGCDDNCPFTPNGPQAGSCTRGDASLRGSPCLADGDCGTRGRCSLAQDDRDGDGLADACDNCPRQANPEQLDSDRVLFIADTSNSKEVFDPVEPGHGIRVAETLPFAGIPEAIRGAGFEFACGPCDSADFAQAHTNLLRCTPLGIDPFLAGGGQFCARGLESDTTYEVEVLSWRLGNACVDADAGASCAAAGGRTSYRRSGPDLFGNACDADYDNDGEIASNDFNHFRAAFGTSVGETGYAPDMDSDGNGMIDLDDYGVFRRLWRRGQGN